MSNFHCRIKDYIQPFERDLALQEIRALCSGPLLPVNGSEQTATIFAVKANGLADRLRNRLTYWQSVGFEDEDLTLQVRCEATSMIAMSNSHHLSFGTSGTRNLIRIPRRRCLRYATHGLHEYRGKFFPQLVSALINIAHVPSDGIVVDPMCGSGTTLVEARLAGIATYGLDMNPLSVFISHVKCQALSLSAASLPKAYTKLESTLRRSSVNDGHHTTLPEKDQDYLKRWFASSTLQELDQVHAAIYQLSNSLTRNFFSVCLSNTLRSVSWQKVDDLRVRRDMVELERGEVIRRFLSQAWRSVVTVSAFIAEHGRLALGGFEVLEGDARDSFQEFRSIASKVDAVITSPPYATALPYIDTDRLSLIYLGLLPRNGHAARDRLMIGNREISTRLRDEYWEDYTNQRNGLPSEIRQVIDRIHRLNSKGSAGFRRKNLAALLSKYFFDMRQVLINIRGILRPGAPAFLVVGDNRTTAGGELIQIRTANHLAAIAEDLQFKVVETLSMNMLPSRDIFRKNTVSSEKIIKLKAPKGFEP